MSSMDRSDIHLDLKQKVTSWIVNRWKIISIYINLIIISQHTEYFGLILQKMKGKCIGKDRGSYENHLIVSKVQKNKSTNANEII